MVSKSLLGMSILVIFVYSNLRFVVISANAVYQDPYKRETALHYICHFARKIPLIDFAIPSRLKAINLNVTIR